MYTKFIFLKMRHFLNKINVQCVCIFLLFIKYMTTFCMNLLCYFCIIYIFTYNQPRISITKKITTKQKVFFLLKNHVNLTK